MTSLEARITALADAGADADAGAARDAVAELLALLEAGEVRAATPDGDGWRTHAWVSRGILLAFRFGRMAEPTAAGPLEFHDGDLLPPRGVQGMPGVRVVPGGTSVRRGAHVAPGAVLMPPAFVNVGAYVGAGSMVDSHALVGSCAQIGERVHLSAAAQIGGVLEPPGAMPVIVEDDAMVGGQTGVFEGVRVRRRAVLGAGVVLTRSSVLHDLVHGRAIGANAEGVLEVPEGAVVVMGARPARGAWAVEHGLQVATPLVVKYRDDKTDARVALESALRDLAVDDA